MNHDDDDELEKEKSRNPKTTTLSTQIGPIYQTTERPKNVKIEIGCEYELMDGNGVKSVKIVSIRKINNEIIIMYKYPLENGKWEKTYISNTVPLNTFRAQLLKFGEIKSLDLLYPTDGEENYYIKE